jgi:serine/threonine protein kinase
VTAVPHAFGPYTLLKLLAKGGMGEIYLGRTERINNFEKYYAVKKLLNKFSKDDDVKGRFIDEALLGARLQHPNIVQVFDLGAVKEEVYMAAEFVDGFDLRRILRFCHEKKERIPVDLALFIVREILSGLAYAHRQKDAEGKSIDLIHRDISPQNVLVSFEGEVKIIDFGLAKSTQRSQETQANVLLGNFGYMSPEQARGIPLCHKTDLYSAGIVLFELVTRTKRFVDENPLRLLEMVGKPTMLLPSDRVPDIPKEIDNLYMKATAINKDDRFESAEAFREAITDSIYTINPHASREELAKFLGYLFLGGQPLASSQDDGFNKSVAVQAQEIHQWAEAFQKPKEQDAQNRALSQFADDAPQTGSHPLMRSCRVGETLTHEQLIAPSKSIAETDPVAEVFGVERLDAEIQRSGQETAVSNQELLGMLALAERDKSSEEPKPVQPQEESQSGNEAQMETMAPKEAGEEEPPPSEDVPATDDPPKEPDAHIAGATNEEAARNAWFKDSPPQQMEAEPQFSDVFMPKDQPVLLPEEPRIPTLGSFNEDVSNSQSRLRIENEPAPSRDDTQPISESDVMDTSSMNEVQEPTETGIFSNSPEPPSDVLEVTETNVDVFSDYDALKRVGKMKSSTEEKADAPDTEDKASLAVEGILDPASRPPDPEAWSRSTDSSNEVLSPRGSVGAVTTVVREETVAVHAKESTPKVIVDIPDLNSAMAWAEAVVSEDDDVQDSAESVPPAAIDDFGPTPVSESLIIDFDESEEALPLASATAAQLSGRPEEKGPENPETSASLPSAEGTRPLPEPNKIPLPGSDISKVFGEQQVAQQSADIRPAAQPVGSRRKGPVREVNPGSKKRPG